MELAEAGRLDDALADAKSAVADFRKLARVEVRFFRPRLVAALTNLALLLERKGRVDDALSALNEAVDLGRLASRESSGNAETARDLAIALANLGALHSSVAQYSDALIKLREALEWWQWALEPQDLTRDRWVAQCRGNLAEVLTRVGQLDEAIVEATCARDAQEELAISGDFDVMHDLAAIINTLGVATLYQGLHAKAAAYFEQSAELYSEVERARPGAATVAMASTLANHANALAACQRADEATAILTEALSLLRRPVLTERIVTRRAVAQVLLNRANLHADRKRFADALADYQQAAEAMRPDDSVHCRRADHLIAYAARGESRTLLAIGRSNDGVAAAQRALVLTRRVRARSRVSLDLDLENALNTLAVGLWSSNQRHAAVEVCRELADLLLAAKPIDLVAWADLCIHPIAFLDSIADLNAFHMPLVAAIVEHRELAWSAGQGQALIKLLSLLALKVWNRIGKADAPPDVVDGAATALVSALQSPDLARWLQAQVAPDALSALGALDGAAGFGPGPAPELARLIRAVIDAERVLDALLAQLRHQDGSGPGGFVDGRTGSIDPAGQAVQERKLQEARLRLEDRITEQLALAREAREAYRAGRKRLTESDPKLSSTFTLPKVQTLREAAAHTEGQALLCLLDLPRLDGVPRPSDEAAPRRIVGALLPADGLPARLLEFPGLDTLAQEAADYVPQEDLTPRLGPLRGAPPPDPAQPPPEGAFAAAEDARPPPPADTPPGFTDQLAQRLREHFQAPLQQALREALPAAEGRPLRVHLCLHGLTQQLPLALLTQQLPLALLTEPLGAAGPDLLVWPGLPYLRLAAAPAAVPAAVPSAVHAADAPWIVGHDCAWGSRRPLPMVAVEAELLEMLLRKFGQPVQRIGPQDTIAAQARALVACCHGSVEEAHFDHALHLGPQPLTAGRIMDEHLGPVLTLLPACFAGRIDEDGAGNALGVCAAFMLSGTRLASGSTKPVPDLLQPWLTTLTLWQLLHGGMTARQAALAAREQFAKLDFPPAYRHWLQQALPAALATIQPGGREHRRISGPWATTAIEKTRAHWPWEGETAHLFSSSIQRREQATRSVAEGVLVPRGGEAGARELAAIAREMAAFVAVYGSG